MTVREGGIDPQSTVADIRDALGRLGATLDTHGGEGSWHAELNPGGRSAAGQSEQEAAYIVWQSYVGDQGGTGAS